MALSHRLDRRSLIFGAVAAVGGTAGEARAQPADSFFAGRTVNLIVPFGAGGYYDIGARLIARHLGPHVAGKPNVIVQNLPSAGGLGLANRFAAGADNDGTTIGVLQRAVPQYGLVGYQSVRFDPLKLPWLGSLSAYANDSYLLIVAEGHGVRTIADLQKPGAKIKLGAGRSGSANLIYALVAKDLFNLNIDIVRGYEGTAPIFLALQRGEVDGLLADLSTIKVALSDMWERKQVVPVVQFGRKTRLDEVSNVPTARELLQDDTQRKFLTFAELPFFIALPVAAPSGIPADRLQALQNAFMAMAADPTFLADAQAMNYSVDPISGADVRAQIVEASKSPPDVLAKFKQLVSEPG